MTRAAHMHCAATALRQGEHVSSLLARLSRAAHDPMKTGADLAVGGGALPGSRRSIQLVAHDSIARSLVSVQHHHVQLRCPLRKLALPIWESGQRDYDQVGPLQLLLPA